MDTSAELFSSVGALPSFAVSRMQQQKVEKLLDDVGAELRNPILIRMVTHFSRCVIINGSNPNPKLCWYLG